MLVLLLGWERDRLQQCFALMLLNVEVIRLPNNERLQPKGIYESPIG